MKGIILAAGRGSRMKGKTHECPKCLLKVRGKTLLEWQLIALRESGVKEISIVTGYKRELLSGRGLVEFNNARWNETNMVFSLACADRWLSDDECIVSYSDIIYECSAVKSLRESEAAIAITYDPNWLVLWEKRFDDPLVDAETFKFDLENGRLTEIGNKPNCAEEVQGQYMGLIKFTPAGWAEMIRVKDRLDSNSFNNIHMTTMLQRIIEMERVSIHVVPYEGDWGEFDSEHDLATYGHSQ